MFITPEDNYVDLFNVYLPNLEKVEGFSKDEFMRKALNNDKEFAYKPEDDDNERNKVDTMRMIYLPDRFIMQKMYHSSDIETLTNATKLTEFVK